MNANDRFEMIAAAFYKATGKLAPGKDDPLAHEGDRERRVADFNAFAAGWQASELGDKRPMSATRAEIDAQRAIAAKAWEEGCMYGRLFSSGKDAEIRAEQAAKWAEEELPYPTVTRRRRIKVDGGWMWLEGGWVYHDFGDRCRFHWRVSAIKGAASLLSQDDLDEIRRGPCGPTETVEAE